MLIMNCHSFAMTSDLFQFKRPRATAHLRPIGCTTAADNTGEWVGPGQKHEHFHEQALNFFFIYV